MTRTDTGAGRSRGGGGSGGCCWELALGPRDAADDALAPRSGGVVKRGDEAAGEEGKAPEAEEAAARPRIARSTANCRLTKNQ